MNNRTILGLSFFGSFLFLLIERLVGIGVNFHPDANTYLTTSGMVAGEIARHPSYVLNHGYYLWTYILGGSEVLLILSNMVLFSLTNLVVHEAYVTYTRNMPNSKIRNRALSYGIFLIFIFSLYRLHLSVHILKDTFIVFFSTLLLTSTRLKGAFWLALLMIFRIFGVTYIVLFVKGRPLALLVVISIIGSFLYQDALNSILLDFNEAEMDFREGTSIPSFQNSGIFGVIIRMVVWPFLMLSGLFVFISPSPLYVPIALSSFVLQWWSFSAFGKPAYTLSAIGLLAILAALVPGFTSYQRYCLPILTILPLLIISVRKGS